MRATLAVVAALAGLAACKGGSSPPADDLAAGAAEGAQGRGAVPIPPGAVRVDGRNFHVDAGIGEPCHPGTTCVVRLHLTATGPFKVNKDYPHKFVADPTPGVVHEGVGPFQAQGTKTGFLPVRIRPSAAGPARVSGTFKLSVCDDETCQIEAATVSVDVPVT